jgi:hypothetical protein
MPFALQSTRPKASPLPVRISVGITLNELLAAWPPESVPFQKNEWRATKPKLAAASNALRTAHVVLEGASFMRFGELAAIRRADDLAAWETGLFRTHDPATANSIVAEHIEFGNRRNKRDGAGGTQSRKRKRQTFKSNASVSS